MHRTSCARALGALTLGVALAPHTAAALPLLSEVFYDAAGSDNGLGFVEIYGSPGTILDGFVLEGVNGAHGAVTPSVTLFGSIPEDGFFVVADDAGDGTTGVPAADWIVNFDFQNGPDSVVLRSGGDLVDAVGYGSFGPGEFFAGEGAPAPDAPAAASIARRFANVDSGDNASDWLVADPTPGSAPLAEVPEPDAALLLTGGLVALAHRARRHARRSSHPSGGGFPTDLPAAAANRSGAP
ncbi:MAG: hypothetical protein ACE5FL_11985 [Myxococcota bacterium]